ncbi:MAG: hypothetical protein CSA33_08255 [Desulfobulbus propionicus]|nr:MAG: hypothetical protein CSA33_08255 [Desulfobulbus propionicus]
MTFLFVVLLRALCLHAGCTIHQNDAEQCGLNHQRDAALYIKTPEGLPVVFLGGPCIAQGHLKPHHLQQSCGSTCTQVYHTTKKDSVGNSLR